MAKNMFSYLFSIPVYVMYLKNNAHHEDNNTDCIMKIFVNRCGFYTLSAVFPSRGKEVTDT